MRSVHVKLAGQLVGGADEAGRGAVLGPLVLCVAITEKDKEPLLKSLGVKDSKMLSPERREKLAEEIRQMCHLHVQKISAKQINEHMKKGISLNEVEAIFVSEAIKEIEPEIAEKIEKLYIDAPDPDAVKFTHRIKSNLPLNHILLDRLHSSHKADVKYPIASAASIIAKVTRDQEIEKIKKEIGCDFGTGYPHDELAINCIRNNIDNPVLLKYLRTEWSTSKRLIAESKFKTKQVKLDL
ncbi:MAG: ribonuclease HII [Candidatus Micrarchaeota archaeon]|nr:ribonuclease HII [Candidatus Micrarchaeota archaeon]